jgi:phage tail-like protein
VREANRPHGLLDVVPEVVRVAALPGSPLDALAAVAEDLHEPVLEVLDRLDAVVDPFRAPAALVPFLAGWVDLAWLTATDADGGGRPVLGIPADRLRDLAAAAADLATRRGTAAGLARFLHLATGVDGFLVEDVPGAFHVRVLVPAGAVDRLDLVERLVAVLKPAHVTSQVVPRLDAVEAPS